MHPRSLFFATTFQAVISTILLCTILTVTQAQVRSSSNYQIQSDSINVGGGFSSSASYEQESTVGEIATGPSDSASYSLRAGYQQMQEVYLSLATTGDVLMSPDLPGLSGGTSNGSSTFTVTTDNAAGYTLSIAAEDEPAMRSLEGDTIADYNAGVEPDFSFIINPADAHFGFTPEGVDIVQAFLDDGGVCGVDTQDTALACWDGLATTSTLIAQGSSANHPSGATTTVHFRVGIGSGGAVIAGVYTATTTVTALPL